MRVQCKKKHVFAAFGGNSCFGFMKYYIRNSNSLVGLNCITDMGIAWARRILWPMSAHTLPNICKQWATTYGSRVKWIDMSDTATNGRKNWWIKSLHFDPHPLHRREKNQNGTSRATKISRAAISHDRLALKWQLLRLLGVLQYIHMKMRATCLKSFSNFRRLFSSSVLLWPFRMKVLKNSIVLFVSLFFWHTLYSVDILMLPLKGSSRRGKWAVIRCVSESVLPVGLLNVKTNR